MDWVYFSSDSGSWDFPQVTFWKQRIDKNGERIDDPIRITYEEYSKNG